jgi:hypothetical protein
LHPTYFCLKNKTKNGEIYEKHSPVNHNYRIQFITDVRNDFFNRENEPGDLEIICNGSKSNHLKKHLGLFNGIVTLTMCFPEDSKPGDILNIEVRIIDEYVSYELFELFNVIVDPPQEYTSGRGESSQNPGSNKDDGPNKRPAGFSLPVVKPFFRDEWEPLNADKNTALIIKGGENSIYDFYINMDNIYLLNEIKNIKDEMSIGLMKAKYKYSMVLIGMSIINYYITNPELDEELDIEEQVKVTTSILSPVILPIINNLGDLNESDLSNEDMLEEVSA